MDLSVEKNPALAKFLVYLSSLSKYFDTKSL